MKPSELTYAASGVDIAAGAELVQRIKPIAQKTKRPGVLGGLGGFGALFELPLDRYQHPLLVSSTDGVGTKLKLALELGQHDTIGIDLVAMCVNDILVQGAEPLFFLDYFATGKLSLDIATAVITGIGKGCELANTALVGGETAEMPGLYQGSEYDLAGFAVGIVEKSKLIDGSQVQPGDRILGIASSGVHSNGFSLVRKLLQENATSLDTPLGNQTLGQALLTPTRIYVKSVRELLNHIPVHALAHITGGGLIENIPRVLPPYTQAVLHLNHWEQPPIFSWIQQQGRIDPQEMFRTFNCGIGMIICVPADVVEHSLDLLEKLGERAWDVGEITSSTEITPQIVLN